ncbi:MAG: diguanylate cyclase domain protein [Verrucomicrobiaceae bacterium]|nr:diguanylate cyclase domain protein [Verrucomicrobiaceae bacterium]
MPLLTSPTDSRADTWPLKALTALSSQPRLQYGLFALVYFGCALSSIYLTRQPGHVAAIWWPNALMLATVLRASRTRHRQFLAVGLAASLAANALTGYSALQIIGFPLCDLLEVVLCLRLLKRGWPQLDICYNVRHFIAVLMVALGLGATCSATLAIALIGFTGGNIDGVWSSWWLAECIGMISLLPIGVSISSASLKQNFVGRAKYEIIPIAAMSLVVTWMSLHLVSFPFVVIAIPLLIASQRMNLLGTALIGLANVLLALAVALNPELKIKLIDFSIARHQVLIAMALSLIGPLLVAVLMNQRQRVLRHLQENERTLSDAMEYASIGMALISLEGRWIKVNPALTSILGYTAKELQALSFQDITYPDDLVSDLELVGKIIAGEISHYVLEKRYICKDGGIIWANLSVSGVYGENGKVASFVSQIENIDDRKHAEFQRLVFQRELEHRARHDALTGLINRQSFEYEARRLLDDADTDRQHIACFLDLDRFKVLNDSAGHAAGDALLREIAVSLSAKIRSHDIVARLGGDEFGLLLPDCPLEPARRIAESVIEAINSTHFTWNGRVFDVGASIGLVPFAPGSINFNELLSRADVACYTAKNEGRNRVVVYSDNEGDAARDHSQIQMAASIREALQNERFCLYAQEITPLAPNNRSRAIELLVRLRTEQGQLLPPGAFIPAAERYGLMAGIDRWVISKALIELGDELKQIDNLSIAINLSGTSFNEPEFALWLRDIVRRSPLPASRICFELTETALINHLSGAAEVIRLIQEEGCAVALDDFGSGLSSFTYLKNFAVQFVKIDGSFVRAINHSQIDLAIVESINEIAHRLGAETVAEYVEDMAIARRLHDIGVDYAQGYAFAKPEPIETVIARSALLAAV